MDLGLTGKNVLVVGASKGICREISLAFANEQSRVTTIARSDDLLLSLHDEMTNLCPTDHAFYAADLMVSSIAAQLIHRILNERGVFDIVVHCVGGSLVSRNALGTYDEWLHAWKFNAGLAIELNHVLLPPMIDKGWGRVIHISSISAKMLRGNPLYCSAKAFLNAYVTTVGRELAQTGVVISAVMPGAVSFPGSYWDKRMHDTEKRTDGTKSGLEICHEYLSQHQAVNRFGTIREVADVVLFLASQQASFMQGCVLPVDGASM